MAGLSFICYLSGLDRLCFKDDDGKYYVFQHGQWFSASRDWEPCCPISKETYMKWSELKKVLPKIKHQRAERAIGSLSKRTTVFLNDIAVSDIDSKSLDDCTVVSMTYTHGIKSLNIFLERR
jgi:hypothetical protein